MREKLVELIKQIVIPFWAGQIADHLISNDVVPVVRCKDCKHYRIHHDSFGESIPHCIKAWGGAEVDPMDFCSYGERKDGEG